MAEDLDCSLSDLDHAARQAIAEGTESRAQVVVSKADDLLVSRDIHLWLDRIVEGMANDHFTLYAQPVVGLGSLAGRNSFELLMRWCNPQTQEIVPPGLFLPIAERHRLMGELDRWAVTTAIRKLNAHVVAPGTSVAVNLSGQSLSEIGFGEWLLDAVSRLEVPNAHLIFEITEQSAVRHIDRVHDLFSRLHRLGHRLALDDFGTGFASYRYLKASPLDSLNIYRSVIPEILFHPLAADLTGTTDQLAASRRNGSSRRAVAGVARKRSMKPGSMAPSAAYP